MKKALIMVALLSAFSVRAAQASTIYQLTVDNCTGGCNPGAPGTTMGSVTLTQNGANSVDVTVSLVSPLEFVNTGLHETIDFNLSFKPHAAGRIFSVEAFATDDAGGQQGFESVGTITVLPPSHDQ